VWIRAGVVRQSLYPADAKGSEAWCRLVARSAGQDVAVSSSHQPHLASIASVESLLHRELMSPP